MISGKSACQLQASHQHLPFAKKNAYLAPRFFLTPCIPSTLYPQGSNLQAQLIITESAPEGWSNSQACYTWETLQDPEKPGYLRNDKNDFLNYTDDWYIIGYKPDAYAVIYYRGNNDAWEGYGGLTVYSRYFSIWFELYWIGFALGAMLLFLCLWNMICQQGYKSFCKQ